MPFALRDVSSQKQALALLAQVTRRATSNPIVVHIARQIVQDCPTRDDECELQAIYDAVKRGDKRIKALSKGVRYVSDPIDADYFLAPQKMIAACLDGACAGDCDEHAALSAALAGAVGFRTGLRAWGPKGRKNYEHVYSCAAADKLDPAENPREWLGLDTTVDYAGVGWDPPSGRWLTAIVI